MPTRHVEWSNNVIRLEGRETIEPKGNVRTPVFGTEVTLRADSSTINNDAENNEAYESCHFDRTENELDYA
jgi:hypothetical protein